MSFHVPGAVAVIAILSGLGWAQEHTEPKPSGAAEKAQSDADDHRQDSTLIDVDSKHATNADLSFTPNEYRSLDLGNGYTILSPGRNPIRRGHGGWTVYDSAGRRLHRVTLPTPATSPTEGDTKSVNKDEVAGEEMPVAGRRLGLFYGLRDPFFDDATLGAEQRRQSGTGRRVVSDVYKPAQFSQPLLNFDPMRPLNNAIESLRLNLLNPISTTFQPTMAWIYQHATEVRPGYHSARSTLYFSVDGAVILWDDDDSSGRVTYNIQAEQGAFTAVQPYMGNAVGSPLILNNILVNSDFNLYMLYWHQELFDKRVRISVGKFEDQVFFDSNAIAYNPLTQFLYQGFNQSISNPFPGYGFGGVVVWDFTDNATIRVGTTNSEAQSTASGFENLAWGHLFTMAELDISARFDHGDYVHEGNYRFMLWYNTIGNTGSGKHPWEASGWGAVFNMDQRIYRGLVGFCRVGWGEDDVTPSNFSVSGGFSIEDFLGRQGDCMGVAAGWSKITALGRNDVGLPMTPGTQTILEWFWRVNVTDTIQVSPIIQYVHDAGAGIDGSLIWGVRSVWSF